MAGRQKTFWSNTTTNTVELVHDATCIIRWFDASNLDEACYVQLFDAKDPADVVLGTTDPIFSWFVPAGGGHDYMEQKTQGLELNRGLCIAATTESKGTTALTTLPNINIQLLVGIA